MTFSIAVTISTMLVFICCRAPRADFAEQSRSCESRWKEPVNLIVSFVSTVSSTQRGPQTMRKSPTNYVLLSLFTVAAAWF